MNFLYRRLASVPEYDNILSKVQTTFIKFNSCTKADPKKLFVSIWNENEQKDFALIKNYDASSIFEIL